jgi:hypothetical protein
MAVARRTFKPLFLEKSRNLLRRTITFSFAGQFEFIPGAT